MHRKLMLPATVIGQIFKPDTGNPVNPDSGYSAEYQTHHTNIAIETNASIWFKNS
jgi:hypothetical protein